MDVIVAMGLGAFIGLEREMAGRPAGLRTNMLVAGASCLFVAISEHLIETIQIETAESLVRADPIRVVEAVVTGVSFVAAGTIIRNSSERVVEGLTTASTLLFVAGIGITVAISKVILAMALSILVVIILRLINWVEHRFLNSKPKNS